MCDGQRASCKTAPPAEQVSDNNCNDDTTSSNWLYGGSHNCSRPAHRHNFNLVRRRSEMTWRNMASPCVQCSLKCSSLKCSQLINHHHQPNHQHQHLQHHNHHHHHHHRHAGLDLEEHKQQHAIFDHLTAGHLTGCDNAAIIMNAMEADEEDSGFSKCFNYAPASGLSMSHHHHSLHHHHYHPHQSASNSSLQQSAASVANDGYSSSLSSFRAVTSGGSGSADNHNHQLHNKTNDHLYQQMSLYNSAAAASYHQNRYQYLHHHHQPTGGMIGGPDAIAAAANFRRDSNSSQSNQSRRNSSHCNGSNSSAMDSGLALNSTATTSSGQSLSLTMSHSAFRATGSQQPTALDSALLSQSHNQHQQQQHIVSGCGGAINQTGAVITQNSSTGASTLQHNSGNQQQQQHHLINYRRPSCPSSTSQYQHHSTCALLDNSSNPLHYDQYHHLHDNYSPLASEQDHYNNYCYNNSADLQQQQQPHHLTAASSRMSSCQQDPTPPTSASIIYQQQQQHQLEQQANTGARCLAQQQQPFNSNLGGDDSYQYYESGDDDLGLDLTNTGQGTNTSNGSVLSLHDQHFAEQQQQHQASVKQEMKTLPPNPFVIEQMLLATAAAAAAQAASHNNAHNGVSTAEQATDQTTASDNKSDDATMAQPQRMPHNHVSGSSGSGDSIFDGGNQLHQLAANSPQSVINQHQHAGAYATPTTVSIAQPASYKQFGVGGSRMLNYTHSLMLHNRSHHQRITDTDATTDNSDVNTTAKSQRKYSLPIVRAFYHQSDGNNNNNHDQVDQPGGKHQSEFLITSDSGSIAPSLPREDKRYAMSLDTPQPMSQQKQQQLIIGQNCLQDQTSHKEYSYGLTIPALSSGRPFRPAPDDITCCCATCSHCVVNIKPNDDDETAQIQAATKYQQQHVWLAETTSNKLDTLYSDTQTTTTTTTNENNKNATTSVFIGGASHLDRQVRRRNSQGIVRQSSFWMDDSQCNNNNNNNNSSYASPTRSLDHSSDLVMIDKNIVITHTDINKTQQQITTRRQSISTSDRQHLFNNNNSSSYSTDALMRTRSKSNTVNSHDRSLTVSAIRQSMANASSIAQSSKRPLSPAAAPSPAPSPSAAFNGGSDNRSTNNSSRNSNSSSCSDRPRRRKIYQQSLTGIAAYKKQHSVHSIGKQASQSASEGKAVVSCTSGSSSGSVSSSSGSSSNNSSRANSRIGVAGGGGGENRSLNSRLVRQDYDRFEREFQRSAANNNCWLRGGDYCDDATNDANSAHLCESSSTSQQQVAASPLQQQQQPLDIQTGTSSSSRVVPMSNGRNSAEMRLMSSPVTVANSGGGGLMNHQRFSISSSSLELSLSLGTSTSKLSGGTSNNANKLQIRRRKRRTHRQATTGDDNAAMCGESPLVATNNSRRRATDARLELDDDDDDDQEQLIRSGANSVASRPASHIESDAHESELEARAEMRAERPIADMDSASLERQCRELWKLRAALNEDAPVDTWSNYHQRLSRRYDSGYKSLETPVTQNNSLDNPFSSGSLSQQQSPNPFASVNQLAGPGHGQAVPQHTNRPAAPTTTGANSAGTLIQPIATSSSFETRRMSGQRRYSFSFRRQQQQQQQQQQQHQQQQTAPHPSRQNASSASNIAMELQQQQQHRFLPAHNSWPPRPAANNDSSRFHSNQQLGPTQSIDNYQNNDDTMITQTNQTTSSSQQLTSKSVNDGLHERQYPVE